MSAKQSTDLRDYIKQYDDVIRPYSCEKIIAFFEAHKAHAKRYRTDGYDFTQLDVNEIDESLAMAVASECTKAFDGYIAQLGIDYMEPSMRFEDVRIKKYDPDLDQEFGCHIDNYGPGSSDRFLTFIIYLDDNDEGSTYFPNFDVRVPCKKGSMAVFPPTWQYWHQGCKPVEKPKYILMTSMMLSDGDTTETTT